MLEEILRNLNNYFVYETLPKQEFEISGGTITVEKALTGQYIRIIGSHFNDGVYIYPISGLIDETFTGYVQLLAIPKILIDLSEEISDWKSKHKPTLYTSESFGGYSYNIGTKQNGAAIEWQQVFSDRLKPFKKTAQH